MVTEKRCLLTITGAFALDGGIAAVNRLVIRALAEENCKLDILSLVEQKPVIDSRYVDPDQVSIRTFNKNKVAFSLATWQALRKQRYDYVMADLINLAAILAPLQMLRQRYLVWLYGIDVFPPHPTFEGRLGLKHAWKRLAISNYTKERVERRFPQLPIEVCDLALDPVRHIENLPPQPAEATDEALELEALNGVKTRLGSQVILHVGRMVAGERYKGQDTLLRAFPEISQNFPQAQLVLVGQGDDRARLEGLAKSLPVELQARIFMPGYVATEVLQAIYSRCYLFAMPSKGEGFGLVYLEAMSRAKPCLGGNVDATPHVVRDGVTGLLVDDPTSAGQVAAKINWLLARPDEALAMGQAGYETVRKQYLFRQFKDRFWNIINE